MQQGNPQIMIRAHTMEVVRASILRILAVSKMSGMLALRMHMELVQHHHPSIAL